MNTQKNISECFKILILLLIMVISPKLAKAQFAGGDGSAGNPYQITNITELNEVRSHRNTNRYFILMNDIDARETKTWNNGQGWEPIGGTTNTTWFYGEFNGNGHVIYGLYINRPGQNYVSLFGYIYNGRIKNLGVVDAKVIGREYTGIVGSYLYGLIEHTFSSGEVLGLNHTGGLLGTMIGGSYANVNYSFSHAKATSSNYGASGLVGRQQSGTILNSFSTGTASAPNGGVGGLVGEQNGGTVTNSFWDTEASGLSTSAGQATGKTTAEMHTQSNFTNAGWDFGSKWGMTDVYNFGYPMHQITKKYGGGSGTSGDPYLIKNTFHLRNIDDNNTIYYQLVHDIDLDIYPYNSGKGWKPIGINSSGQEFHGHFNGNGYKIKNLFINRPTEDFIGLFGSARHGSVRNVGFEGVDVTGKSYVGSIVGANYTLISQTYSIGIITANDHGGGLTGLVESWTSSGEISNSYSLANVTATTASAGGLTGRFSSGNINKSYAAGSVSAPSNAGGIVGEYNSGTVENNVFWNVETSGQSINPGGGVGKALSQLKTKSTFTDSGWDFSSVWKIVIGDSTSYPYLISTEQSTPPGKQYKIINYAGGQGSESDPYIINTPQQLDSVRFHLTRHFKLISDIDLDITPFNTEEGWLPIGSNSSGQEFSGSFDGDGYKIRNLFINRPTTNFIGVFAATKNAVIKNIGVENANVTGDEYVGALVGINYSEIRNSYSTGSMKGLKHIGGLVGGIETWDSSNALVSNSYSTASAFSSIYAAGGLVGRQISGIIENSYAVGEGLAPFRAGGLVGVQNSGTVTNSYWSKAYTCHEASGVGTGLSVNQFNQQVSFSGWDFNTVWNIDENNSFPYLRNNEQTNHPSSGTSVISVFFSGGCGTETKPFQIATATQLDSVRYYKDAHFIQTADIDLEIAPYNTGSGWEPIGAESNSTFTGNYNGNGHQILNMLVNRPGVDLNGLFSRITGNANVSNIRIDSAHITGRHYTGILSGQVYDSDLNNISVSGIVNGVNDVGGIIGFSVRNSIDSLHSKINVTATGLRTGGLIGSSDRGSITNSSSSGSVSGNQEVGGVIGDGYVTTINMAYTTANVTASGPYSGGFIGFANRTNIAKSYSVGNVTSTSNYVAGFAGRTYLGIISNSYSTGKVTGINSSARGFVSYKQSTSISNSFWDTEVSTKSYSHGGTPRNTAQMKEQSTFTNWNFSTIWGIDELESYPYLKTNEQNPHPGYEKLMEHLAGGVGTESDPFKVATAVHLDSVRYFMNSHFIQIADIDLNIAPFNTGSGWDPIGTNTNDGKFTGTFNGDGYVIKNLFVNRTTENFNGLFGSTFNAVLKDMVLEDVNVTGQNYNGALVGLNYSEVRNSSSTGSVSGQYHTGGLLGASESSSGSVGYVINNYSTASATSSTYGAGSLVGRLISGSIENSYGVGSVTAPSGNGGLIGEKNSGTVTNSYWDTQTTGQATSADGIGLTTVQMQQRGSFTGFDFVNVWYIEEGSGYPKLQEEKQNQLIITGKAGWRMLSSPIASASFGTLLDSLWTQGFTGADKDFGASNVYTWNEINQSFQSISNATDIPAAGTGFITYVYADDNNDGIVEGFPKTLTNSGTQFTGTASPTLSFTDSGTMDDDGWNLLGNPYGTSIDWDASSGWSKANLDGTFYVYSDSANNGTGSYLTWNGLTGTLKDGKIAPWQGFWVKANAANPSISMNDSVKSSGGTLLKKSELSTIKFTAKSETMSSKAVVLFYKEALLNKDQYDAYKLKPLSSEYMSLSIGFPLGVDDDAQLDINALPNLLEEIIIIPINMELMLDDTSLAKTEITLSWNLESLPTNWDLSLIDQKMDEQIDIKEVSSITFDVNHAKKAMGEMDNTPIFAIQDAPDVGKSKSTNKNRFLLQIVPQNSVANEWDQLLPDKVELQQNYPNPFNPSTTIAYGVPKTGEVTLEVYDILGRKVATLLDKKHTNAGRHTIQFNASNFSSGMYIYRLRTSSSVITKKLTLIK